MLTWKAGKRIRLTIIISLTLGLALPFYVIPNAMGSSFASSRVQVLDYLTDSVGGMGPTFRVLDNGIIIENITAITFSIFILNSYFLPVVVNYRGYELALYIYNSNVDKPGDLSYTNKLVWKVTASADLSDEDNVRFPNSEELADHAVSVPPSGMRFNLADEETAWNGTDTAAGKTVAPGDYFAYAIALGRISSAALITIVY